MLVFITMLRSGTDRNYAVLLLAIAIAVLGIGLALRPRQQEAPKPEIDLAQLQKMAGQRRLRDLSSYLASAANDVAASVVYLGSRQRSGLVWNAAKDVIGPGRVERRHTEVATAPDGRHVELAPKRSAEGVPFEALAGVRDAGWMKPAPRVARQPEPGEWVLAIAKNRRNQVVFAEGLYQGRAASRCGGYAYEEVESSTPLSAALVGGGLFTLDGKLLGFVGECGGRATVISAAAIDQFLERPETLNDRLEAAYGMRVAEMAGAVRPKSPGPAVQVQVTAVWADSAAEAAGLKPGDVMETADGVQVNASADLAGLAGAPGAAHTIGVRRERRKVTVTLNPAEQAEPTAAAANLGLTLGSAADGAVTVTAVEPGGRAQRAGVLKGDVLRRIGTRRPGDYAAAGAALEKLGGGPAVLTLERDGREIEVLVAP